MNVCKKFIKTKDTHSINSVSVLFSSDPDVIRTHDLLLRRQLLYPAELRNRNIPILEVAKVTIFSKKGK